MIFDSRYESCIHGETTTADIELSRLSKTFEHYRGIKEENLTLDQWISVLGLSTQWDMDRIRDLAIKNVRAALATDSELAPKLLTLGQEYRVDLWVMAAVTFLIKRMEPMGMNDVEAIGIENTLKIASLRERCGPDLYGGFLIDDKRIRLTGNGTDSDEGKRIIKELFGLSMAEGPPPEG